MFLQRICSEKARSLLDIVWIVVPLEETAEHLRGTKSKSWHYIVHIYISTAQFQLYNYTCSNGKTLYLDCIFGFLQQFESVGVLECRTIYWHLIPSISLISYPQCVLCSPPVSHSPLDNKYRLEELFCLFRSGASLDLPCLDLPAVGWVLWQKTEFVTKFPHLIIFL